MSKSLVSISAVSSGSTGKIMQGICNQAVQGGYTANMFVRSNANPLYSEGAVLNINSDFGCKLSADLSKITGFEGCFAVFATLKLVKRIDKLCPDIIHLHILHPGYVNLPILTRYLKKRAIPVVWTMHDCWAFTGHCPHFAHEKCEKWKTGCHACPRYNSYPRSLYDNSRFMYKWKKKWFSNLPNLTIVTPSQWLCDLLGESYLKHHERRVIYNGIDLDIFKPSESNFKDKYALNNEKIVLGVSSVWNDKKGFDVFLKLAEKLPSDYKIVLVGTDDYTDSLLPSNVISIHRTENQRQLSEIYSSADVFVNPTREDTFPTVNLEALACGTPVITFKTGGSPESLSDKCGVVVDCDDVEAMEREIKRVCEEMPFSKSDCVSRAKEFEIKQRFKDYIELYEEIKNR